MLHEHISSKRQDDYSGKACKLCLEHTQLNIFRYINEYTLFRCFPQLSGKCRKGTQIRPIASTQSASHHTTLNNRCNLHVIVR